MDQARAFALLAVLEDARKVTACIGPRAVASDMLLHRASECNLLE